MMGRKSGFPILGGDRLRMGFGQGLISQYLILGQWCMAMCGVHCLVFPLTMVSLLMVTSPFGG